MPFKTIFFFTHIRLRSKCTKHIIFRLFFLYLRWILSHFRVEVHRNVSLPQHNISLKIWFKMCTFHYYFSRLLTLLPRAKDNYERLLFHIYIILRITSYVSLPKHFRWWATYFFQYFPQKITQTIFISHTICSIVLCNVHTFFNKIW